MKGRSPAKTSQGHAKECVLGRRSSVFIGNLQLDGAQVDCGFATTDLHRPIAGGEPCQEDGQVSPDSVKGRIGSVVADGDRVGGHGRAEMGQDVGPAPERCRPQKGSECARWRNAEGVGPDVRPGVDNWYRDEVHQSGGGGGPSNGRAEIVWMVQSLEGDVARGVGLQAGDELGGVSIRSGCKAQKIVGQGRTVEAEMGFVEHWTAEEGSEVRAGRW